MFLQIVLLFSYFIGASFARTDGEIKAWFFGQAVECSKDHPVTLEELQMMNKHKLPDHKSAKCLMACVFRKANWLDSKGVFDISKAYALAEKEYPDEATKQENSKKLFDMCKKVNEESVEDGDSGCDRAFYLSTCLSENAPKLGFQI